MDVKFDKEPAEDSPVSNEQEPRGGGRQTIMLVVLLLLLCGFGYVFFFTNLIRTQEPPPSPPPQQLVKKPLPLRDAASAQPADKLPLQQSPQAATKPAEQPKPPVAAAVAPSQAKPVEKKPVAAAAPRSEPAKPTQPQKLAQAPKQEPPKPSAAARQDQKALKKQETPKPEVAVKPGQKPLPTAPSAGQNGKNAALASSSKQKVTETKTEPKALAARKKGPWTLVVGSYVVEEKLAEDMTRVKGQGLPATMASGGRRSTTMYRLVFGSFPDSATSQQAIARLKKNGASPFSIQKGSSHIVVAGSYSMQDRANQEQQRLASSGITVTIQKTNVAIPTRKLTAGTYTDRAEAEAALKKLKKAAIGTPVIE